MLKAFTKKDAPRSEGGESTAAGRGCGVLFGLPFLLAGLAIVTFGAGIPIYNILRATQWVETPCTITASYVETHSGDDGSTYSVEMEYNYTFDGQHYAGDQYDFLDMSSGGRSGKEKVVTEYPVGSQRVCYVNPSSPEESVIYRGFHWVYLLIGGFGMIFVLVGGAVIWGSLWGGRSDHGKLKTEWREDDDEFVDNAAAVTLNPGKTRLGAFIAITIFALIWNGIVFGVIFGGDMDGWDFAFLIPFGLVGIGTIIAAIYFLLGIFNPSFTITVTPGRPYPGQPIVIEWECVGAVRRIRDLQIIIRGQESATYRRGTDTVTEKETFTETTLFQTNDYQSMATGTQEFDVPLGTMHSFAAPNNKIIWDIQVKGDIPRWPDVKDEYTFTVIPKPLDEQ